MCLRLSPHQTLEVVDRDPACLVVRSTYGPGGSPPPPHYHPRQEERFAVVRGRVQADVDGARHDLGPGDELTIEARQVHRMWNAGDEPAEVRWETRPALDTDEWFAELDRLQRSAATAGRPGPDRWAFLRAAAHHRDTYRLVVGGPRWLNELAVRALTLVARTRRAS